MKPSRRQVTLQLLPYRNHEIFCRREEALQKLHFMIEVSVIHPVDDAIVEDAFEFAEVDDVTCFGIGLARYSYLQFVIVTMTARIVAFPKGIPIPLI